MSCRRDFVFRYEVYRFTNNKFMAIVNVFGQVDVQGESHSEVKVK